MSKPMKEITNFEEYDQPPDFSDVTLMPLKNGDFDRPADAVVLCPKCKKLAGHVHVSRDRGTVLTLTCVFNNGTSPRPRTREGSPSILIFLRREWLVEPGTTARVSCSGKHPSLAVAGEAILAALKSGMKSVTASYSPH